MVVVVVVASVGSGGVEMTEESNHLSILLYKFLSIFQQSCHSLEAAASFDSPFWQLLPALR